MMEDMSYLKHSANIRNMLIDFLQHGIDVGKLTVIDDPIESSDIDQIRILNSYRSLVEQRTFFGAIRNINNTLRAMKQRIRTAGETHENPRTLELSLEIVEHISNIAPYIDEFMANGETDTLDTIDELSRILYKKANYLGFYQDIETQLRDAKITKTEVKTFLRELNENVELEMEMADEAAS